MTARLIVNIDVPALAPAIAFYTAALGLRLTRILDDDVAELSGASSVIYLLMKPAGSATAPAVAAGRHYRRHWTPVHLDFVVDDIEPHAQRAIAVARARE